MSRGAKCTICEHPERLAIDALLATGEKLKVVAEQFTGTSVHAVTRHRRKCLGLSATGVPAENLSLEQKTAIWLERSESLWHSAGASLDTKSQAAAVASALRTLELSFRQREKLEAREEQAREREELPNKPLTLAGLDHLVRAAESRAQSTPSEVCNKVAAWLSLLSEPQRGAALQSLRAYLNEEIAA